MKLNIFSIPADKVVSLKEKLSAVKMEVIHSSEVEGWNTTFFFSKDPDLVRIPWINHYPTIFTDQGQPTNKIHYGTYLWEKGGICFAISFGKSHFYLRQYANSDFGLQMATRIANKDDVTQKAARKFVGKKKREVRSYTKESSLDIESGESVDYIQSAIISEYQERFGKIGKFGTSLLLTVDIDPVAISGILDNLYKVSEEDPKFKLPKIEIIKDSERIATYDAHLIEHIKKIDINTKFSDESHYIVGIDFIFPSNQRYVLKFKRQETSELESIDIFILKEFIEEHSIKDGQILDIRVKVIQDDMRTYSKTLKQSLDFILDDERVMLADGEWKEFNEDYLNQLHIYIDSVITIDTTLEEDLREISTNEPTFNIDAQQYGYTLADTNFDVVKLPGHIVEAWDLKKNKTVYAVKFGTTQNLGYVCDQAINTLEIVRNIPKYSLGLDFNTYCLWLGMKLKNLPDKLSDISSIIFKQKLETWARKCREMGIDPVVRLSKKISSSTKSTDILEGDVIAVVD